MTKTIKYFKYILALILIIGGIASLNLPTAYATGEFDIQVSATTKDSDGNISVYNLSLLEYKSQIELTYTTSAQKYRLIAYQKENGIFNEVFRTKIINVIDGKIVYSPTQNGELKISISVFTENETMMNTVENQILSDSLAPTLVFNKSQLDKYSLSPFNVVFSVQKKYIGEIDFEKSIYYYNDENGYIIEPTKIDNSYTEQFTKNIRGNGKLTFKIYDKSGNMLSEEYTYNRYGYGEEIVPNISVSPESDYAKSVTVDITWGELNDNNPNVLKQYAVFDGTTQSGVVKNYQGSFTITTSGEIEIRAYYRYKEVGEKHHVSKFVKVDATPPTDASIKETIMVKVDLFKENPIMLSFRVVDNVGIRRVYYLSSGVEFVKGNDNFYSAPLSENSTYIRIEDFAGNYLDYQFVNSLMFKEINECNKKLLGMNRSLYADGLLNDLEKIVNELNILFLQTQPIISDVENLIKRMEKNVLGEFQKKVVIENGLNGYSTSFGYNVQMENFTAENILLGEIFNFSIGFPTLGANLIASNLDLVKNICGFKKATIYSLNLNLSSSMYPTLNIIKAMPVTYTLGSENKGKNMKVYYEKDGLIIEAKSYHIDNILFFDMSQNGDYYFAIEEPNLDGKDIDTSKGIIVNGKFYSYGMIIGVTAGIVIIIGGIALILFMPKRKRGKH